MLKTLILAGGKGTRIKEYTENITKPLIDKLIYHTKREKNKKHLKKLFNF